VLLKAVDTAVRRVAVGKLLFGRTGRDGTAILADVVINYSVVLFVGLAHDVALPAQERNAREEI
jgi:hypothetical protein